MATTQVVTVAGLHELDDTGIATASGFQTSNAMSAKYNRSTFTIYVLRDARIAVFVDEIPDDVRGWISANRWGCGYDAILRAQPRSRAKGLAEIEVDVEVLHGDAGPSARDAFVATVALMSHGEIHVDGGHAIVRIGGRIAVVRTDFDWGSESRVGDVVIVDELVALDAAERWFAGAPRVTAPRDLPKRPEGAQRTPAHYDIEGELIDLEPSVDDFEAYLVTTLRGPRAAQVAALRAEDIARVWHSYDVIFGGVRTYAEAYVEVLGPPDEQRPAFGGGGEARTWALPMWPDVTFVVYAPIGDSFAERRFEGGLSVLPADPRAIEPWRWTAPGLCALATQVDVIERWPDRLTLHVTIGAARFEARFDYDLLVSWIAI